MVAFKTLAVTLALASILLSGCSWHEFAVGHRKTAYEYDNTKSYALNMLQSTSTKTAGIYDTPGGGWYYLSDDLNPKSGEPCNKIPDAAGNATVVAYNAAAANSLSNVGVSSGVEAGVAGGLVLAAALLDTSDWDLWMPGKDRTVFGWIPDDELSMPKAKEVLAEIFSTALQKTAMELELPEPYAFCPVEVVLNDKEHSGKIIIEDYVYLPISGGLCDEKNCGYAVPLTDFNVFSRPAPEVLGGAPSWQYYGPFPYDGYALPQMSETGELFNFGFDFYKVLSKHLSATFFIVLPMENKHDKIVERVCDGEKQYLQRPIMLSQGEVFRFVPPQ